MRKSRIVGATSSSDTGVRTTVEFGTTPGRLQVRVVALLDNMILHSLACINFGQKTHKKTTTIISNQKDRQTDRQTEQTNKQSDNQTKTFHKKIPKHERHANHFVVQHIFAEHAVASDLGSEVSSGLGDEYRLSDNENR